MGGDVAAVLRTLAAENADLRAQLAAAQDMLMEAAIDVGRLHARIKFLQAERETWLYDATPTDRRWVRLS